MGRVLPGRGLPGGWLALAAAAAACGGGGGSDGGDTGFVPGPCDEGPAVPFRSTLDCEAEFEAQSARPLDASLPGARTVKTVVDTLEGDAVYFQDTGRYPLHRTFAVEQLGWPEVLDFTMQYYSPSRRFLLGAITHLEGPDVRVYELAPYDTASLEMIVRSFRALAAAAWFGSELAFHPTSLRQEELAAGLPDDIRVVTTDELYDGIDYQPLNLGETVGQVRILTVAELEAGYVSPRELAVLDRVPNDISVVAGVVTEEFQTPLSHVNVLSQQRGTPNMGLRDARARFADHAGGWVRLVVGAFDWRVEPATEAEADAWWEAHRPAPVEVPPPDVSVTTLLEIDDVGLDDVAAVGGKAAHFGELRNVAAGVTVRDAFAVPVHFYVQFARENGFDAQLDALLADETFRSDGTYRRMRLAELRAAMARTAPDPTLVAAVEARILDKFGDVRVKLRSSTNAEDLEGHSGAGLHDSEGARVGDPTDPVGPAMAAVWASLWSFQAFEERAYVGIDHHDVAMALLVCASYTDEAANGVAISANPFDPGPTGEDGFYVNAQLGEESVVSPAPGVTADQLVYYFYHPGQPATYLVHSSLVPAGGTVLTTAELSELGTALDAIRRHFDAFYEPPAGFAALPMDVEWKLTAAAAGERRIEVKQARPWPGRGSEGP
ncbi:MAG: hypothetical protein JXB32_08600 [Deltaproteobacteria bacterium]|nr:hypothetical protein [Deltaproteobacteria bacterium]